MSISLRLRLTLIYTALLTGAFLVFAVMLNALFTRSLRDGLEADLASDTQGAAHRLRSELAERQMEWAFVGGVGRLSPILEEVEEFEVLAQDTHLQILDPQGHTLFASRNLGDARLWQEQASAPHDSLRDSLDHPALGRLLRDTVPVETSQGNYTVVGAQSLIHVEQAQNTLLRLFLFTLPLTLALVAVLGYALAHRALRPIADITATAQAIRSGDLSRRIALQGPADELKRCADTFDEMVASIEKLVTSQRRFFADASHELRTPLTVVLSALEVNLEARDLDAPQLRGAMRVMRDETQRMKRLVDDLMVLARAEVGEQALQREPMWLDDLLKDVCDAAQWMVGKRRLSLNVEEEVMLVADADRLKQLVLNLLDNAARHTPPEGEVAVALHRENGHALVTVHDNGEGIASEHLPHIFDRFYCADKARSRARGGAGIGLAICRWIAEAHGGSLTAQSEVGRGTTFALSLPISSPANVK
jgi:heavy metal sensor kinase